jgi:PilZ domain
MNGRLESRVFLTVPLYLHDSNKSVPADLALTENVSSHGARIVTKRAGNPGEEWQIAAIANGVRRDVRVVYCEELSNRNFCIGLELEDAAQNWWDGSQESRTDAKIATARRSVSPQFARARLAPRSSSGAPSRS